MPLKQIQKIIKIKMESQKQSRKEEKHDKKKNFLKKKDKFGRKRSKSFSGSNGNFCPPYKCRKRPMLPTKFLLGGNICDPLNLNSLQDEEINRTVNAVTPKSSPIPTPPQRRGHIEVIIPPNIHDPLNLIDCADDAEYEQQLTTPLKKASKRRKKKKRTSSATTETSDADISSASDAQTPDVAVDSAKIPDIDTSVTSDENSPKEKLAKVTKDLKLELSPPKDKRRKSDAHKDNLKKARRFESMDKIVSPVIPQPGAWLKRPAFVNRGAGPSGRGSHNRNNQKKNATNGPEQKLPQFKEKNKSYQFGNYNRYYGYRNPNHDIDPRLRCFATYRNIFVGADILDIGCNIGHITLSIARDFGAKSIVGLDIDKKLIGIARKNIRYYVNYNESPRNEQEPSKSDEKSDKFFPISMPIVYGHVDIPGLHNDKVKGKGFPHNVSFVQGNYVLEDDALISTEQPQFDVILCLSITKWIHLNWGDAGLKQAFRRMYAQLRPGGKLILEPQGWVSYKTKKKLTEVIYKNYHAIEFFPEKFTQYLLSSEVGFAKAEIMGHPYSVSKGFQRPIQLFTKSDLSPSQSQRSYSVTPSHTITSANSGKCLTSPDICQTNFFMTPSHLLVTNNRKRVYTCLASPDLDNSPSQSQRSYSTPSHTSTSSTVVGKQVYTCITSPDHSYGDDIRTDLITATSDSNNSIQENNFGNVKSVEIVDNVKSVEIVDNVKSVEIVDNVKSVEIIDNPDNQIGNVEKANQKNTSKDEVESSAKSDVSNETKNSIIVKRKIETSAYVHDECTQSKRVCVESGTETMHLKCENEIRVCDKYVELSEDSDNT